jgi:O-antigen/teichoic acid export membrane protein
MTKKANETSKSIFRNVIYGFLAWFFPLILSFVATPIIVKSLGNEEYGIYALVLGFISYSFNFSFGRAVTKYIAEFRVKGENDKINEIISAAFFINLPVGLIGLFFILLFSNWLVADVFNITVNLRQKSQNAFYLAGFTIFLATITQVFTAVLQGLQRYDVYTKIFNFYNIFLVLGNLLLAYFDYDLLWLFSWNLFATSQSCFLFFTALKKLLPNFTLTFRFKREIFKLVLNFSWGVIGYQIISNFLLLFERSWITRQLGSENLTIYVVPMMLAVYIHSFIASLMMVIFPLASELEQNKEKLLRLYQKSTKIVVMLVVFMSMTLILEGKIFLMLWINAEFAEKATSLLTIHTITFGLTAITVVVWYMTEGLGYPNYNFFVFMICLTISISGMFLLTENYGNFGIAIARLAGFGTIFFSIFYVEKWFFKQIQIRFWSKILLIIGISAVIAGSLNKFLISVFSVNWLTFALSVVFSGIVYLICLWFLKFLTTDEKLIFKRIFNK